MSRRTMLFVLAGCLFTLAIGFLIKAQCLGGTEGLSGYRMLCVSELREIPSVRPDSFPYVTGPGSYFEYPVITGVFIWLLKLLTDSKDAHFLISSAVLGPLALFSAAVLARLAGVRALLFALSPAVAFYVFAGWDMLAVTSMVLAVWFYTKDRPILSAVWLGVGASAKFFPGLMLPVLVVAAWRDRKSPLKVAAAGAVSFLAFNLPIALLSPEGFLHTFTFHKIRTANIDSVWAFIWPDASVGTLNLVTFGLLAVGIVGAIGYGLKTRPYPFIQVAAAVLCIFMLANKIQTPGWTLWLMPFFVLLSVHWLWWFAYSAADFLVYVGVYRFFASGMDMERLMFTTGVWARSFLLLGLIVAFLRSTSPIPLDRLRQGQWNLEGDSCNQDRPDTRHRRSSRSPDLARL